MRKGKKLSKREILRRQRKAVQRWYGENGLDWSRSYRQKNPEKIREIYERYRQSPKGQRAVRRYEAKPHRKAAKAFWNFRKNLEKKLENGKITEYEMKKRIKERLMEKPI